MLALKLERKPSFFLMNVAVPNFLLSLFAVTVFFLDTSDVSSRLSVLITLMLTSVAYKFVIAGFLPRIPYNTLLDKYLLASFVLLILVSLENALVGYYVKHTGFADDGVANLWCGIVYCFLVVTMFIVLVVGSCCQCFFPSWEFVMRAKKESEKLLTANSCDVLFPASGVLLKKLS